jgi:Carboxypeptidase regulatory-like domain/TonB dependent receptor
LANNLHFTSTTLLLSIPLGRFSREISSSGATGRNFLLVHFEGERMNFERAKGIGLYRNRLAIVGRLIVGILGVFLVLMQASVARGQRLDGGLRVEVGDSSGASILDAKVTVTNEATGVAISTTTSSSGTYVFPNLLVGTYTVTVEKAGFKKSVQKGVAVQSNQVAEAKLAMELGEVSAVVEVEAGAELVKTESSELSSTFSGRVVNDLPVNTLGGDVKEFAVFAPGTTTQQGGVLGSGGSIGGTRPRFNGFSIDGVDDNRLDINGPTQPVIQESVAEFTLLTNQFSAEYGHSSGGQFNIVTKSGTNNWNGTGWWDNRNRDMNAATNQEVAAFNPANGGDVKNRFDYNRAGASVGGPILKDKLFIYGAYEFQNEGLGSQGATVTMPTANGMSQLQALNPDAAVQAILKEFPVATTPTGTTLVNGQAIEVGQFAGVAPNFFNQHDFAVNADLNLGKHQLRTRFLYDRFRAPSVNPVQPQSQFTGSQGNDGRKVIFTDTWSISNHLINDFRASYSRLYGPNYFAPAAFSNFPNVEIDAFGSNVGPFSGVPQSYTQNIYQGADNLSYIRGKHTFKVGAEFRNYIAPTNVLQRSRGEWDYATLNSFINDLVPDGANGALRGAGSGFTADNYHAFYTFIQDDWKITSRLTLNLGLRYEYTGVPRDEGLQALNSIADDPALGLIFRKPKPDTNNIGPHVGFAWDPTGHGKWAIRGGGQISYDVIPNNFAINSLPPELQSEQNPNLTCGLSNPPAWCATGAGFLQGGGLLQVNVPPTTQAEARAATGSIIPDQTNPKVISWSLGVQHELFKNSSVEVRYVGTRSLSLPVQQRLNSASAFDPNFPGGGIAALPTYLKASDVPGAVVAPVSTLASFDNFVSNPLSVDGFLGVMTTFPPKGSGIYHAVSVDFMHRFAKGFYFRANYTFEKNLDNDTNELFSSYVNPRRAQNGYDFADDWGRSALDLPQKFAVTWVYDLPNVRTENRFLAGVAHGWEFSGTYLAQSGQPITPLSGTDANGNGDAAGDRTIFNPAGTGFTGTTVNAVCNAGPGGATTVVGIDPNPAANGAWLCGSENDANIVGYVVAPTTIGTNAGIINPSARFVQAQVGTKTNIGRNTFSSPGLNLWNMSVLKTNRLTEKASLQFRFQTYDTFNHPNFSVGLPTNNGALDGATNTNPLNAGYIFVSSPTFLNKTIFNGGSRNIELGIKLIW